MRRLAKNLPPTRAHEASAPPRSVDARISILIGAVAASAGTGIAFALPTIAHTASADPRRVASMLALTLDDACSLALASEAALAP